MADPAQLAENPFGMAIPGQPEYAAGFDQEVAEEISKGAKGQKLSLAER